MNIQIALAPDLNISSSEFAAAWNQTPDARAVAQAQIDTAQGSFYDPMMLAGLTVLGNVALSLATSALYDLIKEALAKKGIKKQLKFVERTMPDGSRVIVVEFEDGAA